MTQHRNPTFHRRRNERLRREEAQRSLAAEQDRMVMKMAQRLGGALMNAQMQMDAARGDGAFAFPAGAASGSAH